MKRAAAALLVIAAIGATSVAAWASPAPHKSSPPKLSTMLLAIGQMPTGGSVENSSGSTSGVGCLSNILEPTGIKQTASANVSFAASAGLPGIEEKLATYPSAQSGYQKVVAKLAACKQVNGKASGDKVTGTVGQMSFPHYGNASEAFAVDLTIQGESVGEDVIIVRDGDVVMGINEANLGSPSLSQFEKYIKLALTKVK